MPDPTPFEAPARSSAPLPAAAEPFHVVVLRTGQHLLKQHPALGLTLGYLFLTAVGMNYELLFFAQFDLQILDFADPTDFLLVALRKPLLLIFALVSVFVLVRLSQKHTKWMAKFERYRRISRRFESWRWWWAAERFCYIGIVAGYFAVLSDTYARHNASAIRAGKGRKVWVELTADVAAPGKKPTTPYLLLGTTSRYLLLFSPANGRAEVLPVNNIARLSTQPQPGP